MTMRLVALAILLTGNAFIAGCLSSVQIRAGTPVNIGTITLDLEISESTAEQVEKALGKPYGIGSSMLPFQDKPRTTWSYYYEEGNLEDARRIFLFVYLNDGIYDGYMWFSSLPDNPR